jgi:hypothetical protein
VVAGYSTHFYQTVVAGYSTHFQVGGDNSKVEGEVGFFIHSGHSMFLMNNLSQTLN